MRKKNGYTLSDFRCTMCGKKGVPLPRDLHAQREAGHLKRMYCFYCCSEQNFVELKPKSTKYTIDMFWIEFHGGNFVNGQRRMGFRQFIGEYKQECNMLQAALQKMNNKQYAKGGIHQ